MSEGTHTHPGGSAAILGVQLLRYAGVQGVTLGLSSIVQYSSIVAVGAILGTADLGRFSLLLFLAGLVTMVVSVLTKPGTIQRVFGAGDDDADDDDDEDAQEISDRPLWTLGVGIVLASILALAVIATGIVFQEPIADLLLGDPGQGIVIVWAMVAAGMMAVFRLCEIVIWFEHRPTAFAIVDVARPTLCLIFVVLLTVVGMELEGAALGLAIGTTLAAGVALVALRRSLEPAWSFGEALAIAKQARHRFPIVSSMWVVQNADIFILSRFVDHTELGVYTLASRTGFIVALLPAGFRMALRPLRKGAAFKSMKREYGNQVMQGQLLAYFLLLSMTAVLAMVMLGEGIVNEASGEFSDAAGLIPLSAAAMTLPILYRTVNGTANYPHKRPTFVIGAVFVAVAFIGLSLLIVPEIGIYGPPAALIAAFSLPISYMLLRTQLGPEPIDFPYWSILRAFAVGVAIAGSFVLLHPDGRWALLGLFLVAMVIWFASLFVLRIVPEQHRAPLTHMARSVFSGSAVRFRLWTGLQAITPESRAILRRGVTQPLTPDEVEQDAERLMRVVRRVARKGDLDAPKKSTERDVSIAQFLFADEPSTARQARQNALLSDGADAHELRLLEEVVTKLAKAPDDAWEGKQPPRGRSPRTWLRRA